MKKFYKIVCLASALLMSASAALAAPEALYLVGAFNNYKATNDGKPMYKLTDEDGDGIYTGRYGIGRDLMEFMIFDDICGWESSENIFGAIEYPSVNIYSDRENQMTLYNGTTHNTSAIHVENWEGGAATFSCKYSENDGQPVLQLSIQATKQPQAPFAPEHLYMIGDFNNWMQPDDNDTAGAVVINPVSDLFFTNFQCSQHFNAGEAAFALVMKDQNGVYKMYGTDGGNIKLFRTENGPVDEQGNIALEGDNSTPFYVENWNNAGDILLRFDTEFMTWAMSSWDAELRETPKALYAIVTEDDATPTVSKIYDETDWYQPINAYGSGKGKKVSIIFSTENNANPSPENTFGLIENKTFQNEEFTRGLEMVKGGYPYVRYFDDDEGISTIIFDVVRMTSSVEGAYSMISAGEMLWVVGDLCNWLSPTASNIDEIPTIEKIASGIYEGTLNFPAAEQTAFRFFTDLNGWNSGFSLGSSEEDFYQEYVSFIDGKVTSNIINEGQGNWAIRNWTGGDLTLNVNLRKMQLTITDPNTGVEVIAAEENGKAKYFNLQGVQVSEPKGGVFIKVHNGQSSKISVR